MTNGRIDFDTLETLRLTAAYTAISLWIKTAIRDGLTLQQFSEFFDNFMREREDGLIARDPELKKRIEEIKTQKGGA